MKTFSYLTAAIGLVAMYCLGPPVRAQDSAAFEVRGRGAEDKQPYREGGVVRFQEASLDASLVHLGDDDHIPLPLVIRYEVQEPAPVLLTSRLGTEYWRLYHFGDETMTPMYADDKIDLSEPGTRAARTTRAWFAADRGPSVSAGVVGIRGHYYFLIDQPDGQWLDVTDPPAFFDRRKVARDLTFTLADLSDFSLAVSEIESTWQGGGPLRVKLSVTDAKGREFPVVEAPLMASAGDWKTKLTTEWDPLQVPSGWLCGTLPDEVPEEITVKGTVSAQTPAGLEQREVVAAFCRGEGRVSPQQFKVSRQGYELPRNANGPVRETRAIWVSTRDIATRESIDELVRRVKAGRLNLIVPDVFVRNTFLAKGGSLPLSGMAEEGLDPLAGLLERAQAAGLEVHPWFCVTYRDAAFREWFEAEHGMSVDMIDEKGRTIPLGADVHRPAYRDFMVDLMVGIARDYPVDGIHLDYIRSMGRCFCNQCRQEFSDQYDGALAEATDEQWIRWQRQAIGDIVRRTAERVRKVRPQAKLSAAVFSNLRGGALQGQDPAGWARQGWIDLVLPMDYQMQTLQVRANERNFLEALDDDSQLVTGLSLYMRTGGKAVPRRPRLVREQITLVRRMGIHGYCLFAYGHLDNNLLKLLSNNVNSEPAVPFFR
ncbi:MAG: glycoside hydrolase family 10 protein [Planctomycetota bacterium]